MPRAERPSRRPAPRERPRFEIDRAWLLRLGLAAVVAVGVVLVARVSVVAFAGGTKRLHRVEQQDEVRTVKATVPAQLSR
jgi:hypothetical protein